MGNCAIPQFKFKHESYQILRNGDSHNVCVCEGARVHKCMFVAVCSIFMSSLNLVSQTKVFALLACLFVYTVGCLRSGCMFTASWKQQLAYIERNTQQIECLKNVRFTAGVS